MGQNFGNREILGHLAPYLADIRASWPHFDLALIIHHRGQRSDQIEKTLAGLKDHPCGHAARELLYSKNAARENSSFIGIAIGREKKFLGLHSQQKYLALININLDNYEKLQDCLFDLYHFMAQAMDTMNLIQGKNLKATHEDIVLQPKRNQLSLARINLKADVFSALMMTTSGVGNAVHSLAQRRSLMTLSPQSFYRPEDYPFPISLDVALYATQSLPKKGSIVLPSIQIATSVASSFDKHNLSSWTQFASPAQMMAWNGKKPDEILSAAIHTCTDPFVKATGHMVAEITDIQPAVYTGFDGLNPYADDQINKINHLRLAEETFELAIIDAVNAESHLPLIQVANSQNEDLLSGKVMGWCAHALHAAARAFEINSKKGMQAAQASRLQFQGLVTNPDWDSMKTVNGFVLSQRRHGYAVTLSDLTDWCKSRSDLRPVMEAINLTLSDPGYHNRLAAANDLPMPSRQPQAAPKAAPAITQPAPQYAAAPQMGLGGMGGGGMGGMGGGMASTPAHNLQSIRSLQIETGDEDNKSQ